MTWRTTSGMKHGLHDDVLEVARMLHSDARHLEVNGVTNRTAAMILDFWAVELERCCGEWAVPEGAAQGVRREGDG